VLVNDVNREGRAQKQEGKRQRPQRENEKEGRKGKEVCAPSLIH